jgi:hypothetical protein
MKSYQEDKGSGCYKQIIDIDPLPRESGRWKPVSLEISTPDYPDLSLSR